MEINDEHAIHIEVAYVQAGNAYMFSLAVPQATTIRQAIEQSGILDNCSEIDLDKNKVGVFGKICDFDTLVADGDRIEIYRELIADPKEARRKRAADQKTSNL